MTTKDDTAKKPAGRKPAAKAAAKPAAARKPAATSPAAKAAPANAARKPASAPKGLSDLLEHAVKDMYYAEKKVHKSLPKMIKAAQDGALADALTRHRAETEGQIETLTEVFAAMGKRPKAEKCDAIDGILAEAEAILSDFGGTPAADAAIIFSSRAVEHYEICRYDSMIGFAEALGMADVAGMLRGILDQEKAADAGLDAMSDAKAQHAAA